jgi:glycosyltransferase involved in cell wall biosynthesis
VKILLANSTCKLGGVSTFMVAQHAALRELGHECELFFFEHGTMDAHLPADARVHFGTLADCLRLVCRERFDVVHANNVDWATGISAVRAAGARLVLTAHKARDTAWTYGWTRANCDGFATVSRWIRDELQPYTDAPIQVVHNGVDVDRFSPDRRLPSSPPIVAWIGRSTSPLKGFETLAAIAPALHAAGLRLWVMDQHGAARAAELFPRAVATLTPLVERWDGVPYDRMPDLYREVAASGGCVLSTSTAEGLPLALLEAQACGCLVVASDVRGNNECVLPEHGGLLFPLAMSGDAVAAAIIGHLQDPTFVQRERAKAVALVRDRFSIRRMAESYLRLYVETLPAARPTLPARVRARLRLSPLVNWGAYLEQRWGVGQRQYEAGCQLIAEGDAGVGAAVTRAAAWTAPTLYLKPRRFARLFLATTTRDADRPTPAWRRAARSPGRSSG